MSRDKEHNVKDIVPTGHLFEKTVEEVMSTSMLPYSEYVIMDRALPRVEDGLKPVQRRILFDMLELGVTPDKPFKKSARIVGDTLGKFHPHGDSSVYGAMVRMAQDFVMGERLVEGQGNFGSIDGDGAAAMRYTEVKLTPLALELMKDLDKDTVTYSFNFDDTLKEPDYLTGRFPNLFVNGASGIAVGLATNIPTHNLGEMIDGCIAYIDNPKITLEEMMQYVKGPDFPTGGMVCAGNEMLEAYTTGRGKVAMRAVFHLEDEKNGKTNIVITELPYQVNKAEFLKSVGALKEKMKDELADIIDILDESDKQGIRAVITLKKDADVDNILALLLKHTDMQLNFNYNVVAIADGSPKQLGLLDYLSYYTRFQLDIIVRRTQFDLDRAKARAHIVEGLCIAIQNIDEVIRIIKTSSSTSDAKAKLMERFLLTDVQTQAILDMRLSRLTNLETVKLQEELAQLRKDIEEYNAILASQAKQFKVIKKEMLEIKAKYATERKTKIVANFENYDITPIEKLLDTECAVAVTNDGLRVKALDIKQIQNASANYKYDNINALHKVIARTSTNSNVCVFTNFGNFFRLAVRDVPNVKFNQKGTAFSQITNAETKEKIIALFDEKEMLENPELIMVTQDGYIKRVETKEYETLKSNSIALKLKDFDRLITVQINDNMPSILIVSNDGMAVNCEYKTVPLTKRNSGGVIGMSLNDKAKAMFASQVNTLDRVLVVTPDGSAKKFSLNEIPVGARNRKGLKIITGKETIFSIISPIVTGEVILEDKSEIYAVDVNEIPIQSRTSACKPLIKKAKLTLKDVGLYLN
ncbi:MAG: DNA topoisomerase 4 subunit A [Clostridiales bacterium]|nr:DNA topoisomerase 4 subunit A [Clostridiales bacterium]